MDILSNQSHRVSSEIMLDLASWFVRTSIRG
jgi:hypothetical protein